MEYNLQKTIESNLGYLFPTRPYLHLTSYPNIDYVNPGIGCVARLHSIYVPIYSKIPYKIEKVNQSLEQGGKGMEIDTDDKQNDSIENELNIDNHHENPEEFNEQKKRSLVKVYLTVFSMLKYK